MIGETTLAMLYVPLFFYIFDQFIERRKAKADALKAKRAAAEARASDQEGH